MKVPKIAKLSNLGYWQLMALIWMVALVLYLESTATWVANQGALSSLPPLPGKVFCSRHRPHFQISVLGNIQSEFVKSTLDKKGLQLTKMFPSMSQPRPLQGLRFVVTSHVNVRCGHKLESNSPSQHSAVIQFTSARNLLIIYVRW